MKLLAVLTLLSSLVGFASFAEAKKTVCTVTINSNEEAEVFRKSLDPELWNFIELIPNEASSSRSSWLADSCKPEIQCDILLVSGHFGGSFFGKTGFSLSMSELETSSCNSSCDGITKRPKEVFLFGCNTLASKQSDSRTPEEYYQVLIRDGFTPREASQIAALRYSPFGSSFHDQMTQVFDTTPRIYGFSSIGPSGKKVKPLLENYFATARSEYNNFDRSSQLAGTTKNQKLFTALKVTAIDQAIGFNIQNKTKLERPYCVLASETKTRLQKLSYILELFQQQQALNFMAHITKTISTMRWENLSSEELRVLTSLRTQVKTSSELQKLMASKTIEALIKIKADIFALYHDLKIMSDADYHSALARLIKMDQPFTDAKAALLCDLDLRMDLKSSDIPPQRWNEEPFYYALNCLKPYDTTFFSEFERHLNDDRKRFFIGILEFSTLRGSASRELEALLIRNLTGSDQELQAASTKALSRLKHVSPELKTQLFTLLDSPKAKLRGAAVQALVKPANLDTVLISKVLKLLKDDPDSDVRVLIAESLGNAGNRSPSILNALQETTSVSDEMVMITAFTALQKLQEAP